jgi:hypothetical protein
VVSFSVRLGRFVSTSVIALALGGRAAAGAQSPEYRFVQRVMSDTGENGFPVIDPVGRRLYGIGDQVIDIDSLRPVATLHNAEHGFVIAPDIDRGIGMDGSWFKLSTLTPLGKIDADAYTGVYDSATARAFLVRQHVWVVDMRQGRVAGAIDLGANAASAVSDGAGMVYVTLGRADSMAVIDARTLRIVHRWGLAPCHLAGALAMDRHTRRLFVSCQGILAVVNADNGHVVATAPTTHVALEIAFDPGTQLIFNPNGARSDSTMTVIHEDGPDAYRVVQRVPTGGDGTRFATVDPVTHRVYIIALPTDRDAVLVFAPGRNP